MFAAKRQRVSLKFKDPNPLFKKWIKEWLNYSEEKNLKNKIAFAKALNSLQKYPLPLNTGRDCIILEGFGPTICKMLDQKLMKHKRQQQNKDSVRPMAKDHLESCQQLEVIPSASSSSSRVGNIVSSDTIVKIQKNSPKKRKIKLPFQQALNAQNENDSVIMTSGTFEIILLVDTQETNGKSKRSIDTTICEIKKNISNFEVRHLNVGDFVWICRDVHGNELVLPYIVERKRIDDFGSSIKDGRFHEQKFRLRQSGIPNVIYMIEQYNTQHTGLPLKTLMQAATNTQVHSNFTVKFTDGHKESMLYLAVMTNLLMETFKNKVLVSSSKDTLQATKITDNFIALMKFDEFKKLSSKTKPNNVRELFIRQLLQLSSLSIDKALAITDVYPTPRILINAYEQCSSTIEAEKLLSQIQYGALKRIIGLGISKTIYQFYNNESAS